VRAAEAPLGKTTLAEAVARGLFKLMAYKDEYEVARLHAETGFRRRWRAVRGRLQDPLPPGAAADREAQREGRAGQAQVRPGHLQLFRLLAKLQGLRGTAFDVSAAPKSAAPSAR
jgi:indolepyruvate ferredoxin oxidoreductase